MCVAPTTYAQADLDALHRVGDPGLSAIATNTAGDIVDQILGVASVRGASLVGDGPLTGPAVQLLSDQGQTVAIGAANLVAPGSTSDGDDYTGPPATADVTPVRYTPQVVAAPFDPAVGAALAGMGTEPLTPSYLDPALDIPLQHDSAVARRQDALGALLWRGLQPETQPRAQIVVPPLMWSLQGRRCAGDSHVGRLRDQRRAGAAAAVDRGDRRRQRGARRRISPRRRAAESAICAGVSTTPSSPASPL